jgi:hypothetical protein
LICIDLLLLNRNKIMDAEEYRKITRSKLLSQHHDTLVNVLEFMHRKIEKEAKNGHNSCVLTFLSPLHYTDSTSREVFNVVSLSVQDFSHFLSLSLSLYLFKIFSKSKFPKLFKNLISVCFVCQNRRFVTSLLSCYKKNILK